MWGVSAFLNGKKRFLAGYIIPQKQNPRFRAEKTARFFCEEARRIIRFFCPKSHTGTAEGVPLSHAPERSEHGIIKALGLKRVQGSALVSPKEPPEAHPIAVSPFTP
jgi:hypothetical protein